MSSFINSATKIMRISSKSNLTKLRNLKYTTRTLRSSTQETTTLNTFTTIPENNTINSNNENRIIAAQNKYETSNDKQTTQNTTEHVSFARMFRQSALVQMGDPEGAVVKGKIIEIMDDNLFIDFGAKLHCVCRKPRYKSDQYRRGTEVVVLLNDLELASTFMGSDKAITLLEADAILLGLSGSKISGRTRESEWQLKKQTSGEKSQKDERQLEDEVFVGEVVEDDWFTNRQEVVKVMKADARGVGDGGRKGEVDVDSVVDEVAEGKSGGTSDDVDKS